MKHTPKIARADIELLEEILGESGDWMLAREIAHHPKWRLAHANMSLPYSERWIRASANASNGSVISFPGSGGYRLKASATPNEVEMAIRKLLHQAGEMVRRANQIEQFGNPQREGVLI